VSKVSLKDMKIHNRRLVLQSVINNQKLSRIALSNETGLAPSTVTTMVAELLDEKVLVESGLTLSTGGRGRKELQMNPEYGFIAIIEISRQKSVLYIYDMSLEKLKEQVILEHRRSGSNLFFDISSAIIDNFYKEDEHLRLAGIGLLFKEDMNESDLSVMFSTSLSADIISLKDALFTQFKVPVVGEYSVNELLNTAINETEVKNSVHIALANTILLSLTIDGRPLEMNGGNSANITRILSAFHGHEEQQDHVQKRWPVLTEVAEILALLCGMFPLDMILLSGDAVKKRGVVSKLRKTLASILAPGTTPPIKVVISPDRNLSEKMAVRMRNIILGTA